MKRFEGKTAVITGGNSGIGLATVKQFHEEGAKVAISGRDQKTLDEAVQTIGPGTLALGAGAPDWKPTPTGCSVGLEMEDEVVVRDRFLHFFCQFRGNFIDFFLLWISTFCAQLWRCLRALFKLLVNCDLTLDLSYFVPIAFVEFWFGRVQ